MKSKILHNLSVFVWLLTVMTSQKCIVAKPVTVEEKDKNQNTSALVLAAKPGPNVDVIRQLQPPRDVVPQARLSGSQTRPMLFIKNDVSDQHLDKYKIVHQSNGEPCLTISWQTNPDGSGPGYPKIYLVDGQFKLVSQKGK